MEDKQYEYGMIGLGTMGRNLVFNMNDKGYTVAGFDKDLVQTDAFTKEAADRTVKAFTALPAFIAALKQPRMILLLVPAGKIVDTVINELKPYLTAADLIIDCGNSHYTDTTLRMELLAKDKIGFMGAGVSGGENGARLGPSIMPGGRKEDYERVGSMLQAISAKVNREACVCYLGPGASGHYVKMVHNGIEYGLMQLIAETYHLLKIAGHLSNEELHEVFSKWNEGRLRSFLTEITAGIFLKQDELSLNRLLDMIVDSASQKGTGAWTSEDAMALQVPVPVIDMAVSMRDLSACTEERNVLTNRLSGPELPGPADKKKLIEDLEAALFFAINIAYAQGFALLKEASLQYKYNLNLAEIAKIWRGGCIIRAELLEEIMKAYTRNPELSHLLGDKPIAASLDNTQQAMRRLLMLAMQYGIPAPAFMASLSYYDAFRSPWLPANLIQAQRDCFGAHTYKRTDREGVFHSHWI
jgi:6-phosphogluconate dehydrogenase